MNNKLLIESENPFYLTTESANLSTEPTVHVIGMNSLYYIIIILGVLMILTITNLTVVAILRCKNKHRTTCVASATVLNNR